jgi:uncharacterized protein YjcR
MKLNAAAASREAEWRAEDDLRTLLEAEKIKKDSKRYKAAQAMAKAKMAAMNKVATGGKE